MTQYEKVVSKSIKCQRLINFFIGKLTDSYTGLLSNYFNAKNSNVSKFSGKNIHIEINID